MTSNPTGGVLGRRRTMPEIGRARPVATRVNNVIAWLRARGDDRLAVTITLLKPKKYYTYRICTV